ncbi:MAG: hypothetical protein DI538_12295 [Azospira oryzae]|nr:MAG: hypothetical protein DI538_12295 [Azospira oryzae]
MKNYVLILMLAIALTTQAQVQTPQPSTASTVTNVVGLTEVKIEYSRPKMKGRKIYGEGETFLVPFGKMWRTAANSGSRITFSDEVKFGDTAVPKGTYQLITVPGATQWTVILSKDMTLGGSTAGYDAANDVAKVTVKPEKLTEKVELFTMEVTDIAENSKTANIQIAWENTSVKVPFSVDYDAKVMKAIEASTKPNPNVLYQSALYYFENGKDLKQANEWIAVAAAANPDAFWIWLTKAKIQKALGDKKGALESATASKAAAEKAKNTEYVKMNDELIKGLK